MTVLLGTLLALALVALLIVCFGAYHLIESLRDQVDAEQVKHEQCHEATIMLLKRTDRSRNQSAILREMAIKYDSLGEQSTLTALGRQFGGDKSVPALWMEHQADLLDERTNAQAAIDHGGLAV